MAAELAGRLRLSGHIAAVGSSTGTRTVVGRWLHPPFGRFADVMVEAPDGIRTLLAPTPRIAASVAGLAPVDPPMSVGFSSAPRTPSVTTVTTTIGARRAVRPR